MQLVTLRHFVSIARHEHLGRAAEELRVAQPSLSRSLARLEDELGVTLVDRVGRRIRLNERGAVLLGRVERALAELDGVPAELADLAGEVTGRVRVGVETALVLARSVRTFAGDHPDVEVSLVQRDRAGLLAGLRQGDLDLGLTSMGVSEDDLLAVPLLDEPVLLATPLEHRLAGRDSVTLAEVLDEPLVTTRAGSWQRALVDRIWATAGATPRLACEVDEPAATQDLVALGLGVGLIPDVARRVGGRPEVAWLRLDGVGHDVCRRSLIAVRLADRYATRAALALLDRLAADLAEPVAG